MAKSFSIMSCYLKVYSKLHATAVGGIKFPNTYLLGSTLKSYTNCIRPCTHYQTHLCFIHIFLVCLKRLEIFEYFRKMEIIYILTSDNLLRILHILLKGSCCCDQVSGQPGICDRAGPRLSFMRFLAPLQRGGVAGGGLSEEGLVTHIRHLKPFVVCTWLNIAIP